MTYTSSDKKSTNCRWCSKDINNSDPAFQYQNLKIIQKTVRVPSSLYTMNLGALNVYQQPGLQGVNWNQMSDRRIRHIQPNTVAGGSFYHSSSTRRTITRNRPGAGCPGGSGVDIKHNSYDRYLNRIKGKGPVRRGVIPPDFGRPIVFNAAFPIYGGKTTKTSIVNGCNCPIDSVNNSIYDNSAQPDRFQYEKYFNIGTTVYATDYEGYYIKATVIDKSGDIYTVMYDDGTTATKTINELKPYFDCTTC